MLIGPFARINSGDCESHGMRMLKSKKECEEAADVLELSDSSLFELQDPLRPQGCIYASNDWLSWASPHSHSDPSKPCGSIDSGMTYSCICSRTGNFKPFCTCY